VIPGARWAILAEDGSLFSSRRRVSVVSKFPFGCVTDLFGSCVGDLMAGAPCWSSEMFAPVSMIAVVARLSGFLQPEVMCNESTKEQQLSVFSLIIPLITAAGSPRQARGFQ
jgi:hypothetical protein